MKSLEQAFGDVEQAIGPLAKAVDSVEVTAKQVLKVAHGGDVGEVRRSLDKLVSTVEGLRQAAAHTRAAWPGSDSEEELYIQESYETELIATLQKAGIPSFRHGGDIMAFPFVLSVVAKERALKINGRKSNVLRPSAVVALLERSRKPRYSNERFLEALFGAYRTIVGEEGANRPVTLRRLYETLTLLPTAEVEYPDAQFVRDIYAIDRNGPRHTKSGVAINLVGSTGTKSKKDVYAFVGPDGELVEYYGVQFTVDRK